MPKHTSQPLHQLSYRGVLNLANDSNPPRGNATHSRTLRTEGPYMAELQRRFDCGCYCDNELSIHKFNGKEHRTKTTVSVSNYRPGLLWNLLRNAMIRGKAHWISRLRTMHISAYRRHAEVSDASISNHRTLRMFAIEIWRPGRRLIAYSLR